MDDIKYYSYNNDDEIEEFETEEQAKAAADDLMSCRDELPKRYPSIQQDHARRIRRIQRWIVRSGTADNDASTVDMTFDCEYTCAKVNQDRFITRTCRANILFKREIQWLYTHSHHQLVTIDEQKARIEELSNKLNRLELVWRESCDD